MDFAIDRTKVRLVPHDPDWFAAASAYSAALHDALGPELVDVHHIGSTSIAGIAAKPTIDLLGVVRRLAALDALAYAVRALGYQWKGEFGLAGRRYCTLTDRDTSRRLVNLHMYEQGWPDIDRHLAFRDYLRAHPAEAQAYEAEKQRAAARQPHDSLAYNDEKSAWIQACERRALAWWAESKPEA